MDNPILKFIIDILSAPAILVGLVSLIGLVALRKPASEVIKGTVKTIMGFLVLGAGADFVVKALQPFGALFEIGFNLRGVVPNNEAIVAQALGTLGQQTALIMAFGMVVNILLARFTRFKYIFLTGHHTLYMACMIAAILFAGGMRGVALVLVGSLILGLAMVLFPALAQPTMRKITGTDEIGFGHFSTVGYWLSAQVGKLVGKGSKSTEEMNFPKSLNFMRDTSVAISITMAVIYFVVTLVALINNPTKLVEITGAQNWVVFALLKALSFAGGVYIILAGVRLVLGEIVPAFKGIAEKLVPNAKPALDCPVVYPYAPNAVIIGFLSSFAGGLVGMLILIALRATVILPGVVPHFFCGATAGVFGNATGGRRGAVLGAFAQGLLLTFLPVFLMPTLGDLGFANTTFSDADFGVLGILLGKIMALFH
ncbi:putative integral membrane protein [Clostridiaceae bacterium JG1575]|nr:putative integral membrane protein [Clostridiaceae bacterium JG1575]